jgi:ParB/RepB/Spo0J family partition protein
MQKTGEIKTIAINKLIAHPANANVMSETTFGKLVRNIERTGLYEPIVVRTHPQRKGRFQIINGHHRVKALEKLGRKAADCVVWDADDQQTAVLLATLNRLAGSDEPAKKIELLKKLKEKFGAVELAKIIPHTRRQIEQLTDLKLKDIPTRANAEGFAVPMVFFVSAGQGEIIETALSRITPNPGQTRAQRRAAALTSISENFMRGEKCRTEGK